MSTTTPTTETVTTVKRPNAFVRLYRGETSFDFVGRRRYWYLISGTIILAGLISLGVRGLNLGIDFRGGTEWTVPASTLSVSQATKAVEGVGVTPSVVENLGSGSSRSIEVEADLSHLSSAQQATDKAAIGAALAKAAHTSVQKESIDDVGATWGATVTDKAIEAMVVFFILVTIYIAIRFQWRMAIAALLKVILHDLLITVGIFSLTGFQVTPDAVIAVLTIMGYSLYDTVVVFDKINENTRGLGTTRRFSYSAMVNLSLNQVLARSLNTSLVAVLPVLSVLVIGAQLLGANTLQQFGFPLVIGLIAGAYSSIFIAAPLPGGSRSVRAAMAGGPPRSDEILTPRAAASLLAGPGSTRERGRERVAVGRGAPARGGRQGEVLRPGTVAARRAAAEAAAAAAAAELAALDEEELVAGSNGAGAPRGAGNGTRTGTSAAQRPRSPASGARQGAPRPRKGGGKSRRGRR